MLQEELDDVAAWRAKRRQRATVKHTQERRRSLKDAIALSRMSVRLEKQKLSDARCALAVAMIDTIAAARARERRKRKGKGK